MRDSLKSGYFLSYVLLLLFFFYTAPALLSNAQAQNTSIWQIGSMFDLGEFSSQDKKVIDYQVPSNWELLLDQNNPNWGEFPSMLYPLSDSENRTEELKINFLYSKDYGNPTLRIKAKMEVLSVSTQYVLEVSKGETPIPLNEEPLKESIHYIYRFSVGHIKRGDYQINRIVIKLSGPPEIPILFDSVYLEVNETDSDGDGISDTDEGDLYKDLADAASIPLASYKPDLYGRKRIILHIEGSEDCNCCFREVSFLARDTFFLPDWMRENCFLPYEFLDFKVENVVQQEDPVILISIPDTLNTSSSFYAYQNSNDWHEVIHEIIDGNTARVRLSDGGPDDLDNETGTINSILALSYPYGLKADVEKRGCFIETLYR